MFRRMQNPVMKRIGKSKEKEFDGIEEGHLVVGERDNVATYKGVILKTAITFAVTILSGLLAILITRYFPSGIMMKLIYGILAFGGIISFIFVIIGSFKVSFSRVAAIVYAIAQGVTLGLVTYVIDFFLPGIAMITIGSTTLVFVISFVLFAVKAIREIKTLYKIMISAGIGIVLSSVALWIISLTSTAANFMNLHLGFVILITAFVVIYASVMLIFEFNQAKQLVETKTDAKYEWQVVLGILLAVVLVYVYLLRMFTLIMGRNR